MPYSDSLTFKHSKFIHFIPQTFHALLDRTPKQIVIRGNPLWNDTGLSSEYLLIPSFVVGLTGEDVTSQTNTRRYLLTGQICDRGRSWKLVIELFLHSVISHWLKLHRFPGEARCSSTRVNYAAVNSCVWKIIGEGYMKLWRSRYTCVCSNGKMNILLVVIDLVFWNCWRLEFRVKFLMEEKVDQQLQFRNYSGDGCWTGIF